jgi:hypothetical protein
LLLSLLKIVMWCCAWQRKAEMRGREEETLITETDKEEEDIKGEEIIMDQGVREVLE